MYRPLLRGARFRVDPFLIRRADGWSGVYSVTVARDMHIILSVTVKPQADMSFCDACGVGSQTEYCPHCGKDN